MAILDELRERGYTDVRPLEKLVYTDGKTYEFPHGMYFACHAESDTETTVFNSYLKKLGFEGSEGVRLRIKNSTSNEWNARREKSKTTNVYPLFNTKKIRAALLKSCGLVILHGDNDKSNYCVSNLKIGTPAENQEARHANPETTGRKRVDIIDTKTRKRIRTCDSRTQAAEWFERSPTTIYLDVRFNRTREIGSYRVTKHKSKGVKYYVVDAT